MNRTLSVSFFSLHTPHPSKNKDKDAIRICDVAFSLSQYQAEVVILLLSPLHCSCLYK